MANSKPNQSLSNFRIIVLCLFSGLFFYVGHQLTRFSDFSPTQKILVLIAILIPFASVLSMPLYFWLQERKDLTSLQKMGVRLAETSMGYLNYILLAVVLRDIVAFVFSLFQKAETDLYSGSATVVILLMPFVLMALGFLPIWAGPLHKKVALHFPDLPQELHGIKIVHISDLHLSLTATTRHLNKTFAIAQKINADIVCLTGDIIDGDPEDHKDWIQQLGEIPNRHGIFYCLGNHEYYWDANRIEKVVSETPIRVLKNEAETITLNGRNLVLAGVNDPAAKMFNLEGPNWEKVKAYCHPEGFKILLCHQPFLADHAVEHGFRLQLSGHTHNGQFIPWNLLIRFFQKYPRGIFDVESANSESVLALPMKLYVNQGTGYWGPPLRLGTFCEITEIHLLKA